jgi:hypothetical protein
MTMIHLKKQSWWKINKTIADVDLNTNAIINSILQTHHFTARYRISIEWIYYDTYDVTDRLRYI